MTRFAFDTSKAIETAWEMLWAANLKRRKENEAYAKKTGKQAFDAATTYYLCAADIVRTVRGFAQQTLDGKPWSLGGYAYTVRVSGDLQRKVRDWLLYGNRGKIVGHNFGKGHISGMRFRPAGEPMAPAELSTIAEKERKRNTPRPKHYSENYGSTLLCMQDRKRSPFSRGRRRNVWTTRTKSEVTCPRCIKLLPSVKELKCANCNDTITQSTAESNKGYCDECAYEAVGEGVV